MKNTIFITNMIKAIFVFLLLLFVFTKNEQLGLRIMIVSFLLLTICYMAENICKCCNKPLGAKIFHKLFVSIFLLFGFGFLIVWSYAWIKEKQYFPILFTIPFWLFGIHIFRKSLLGMKSNSNKAKKENKFDFRFAVSGFLVICILLTGAVCLVIGIRDTYQTNKNTKNYLTATAYFKDYEIYDSDEKMEHGRTETHTTYCFRYVYNIDGKEYTIKTDYGSGSVPDENSSRQIKYNPDNPGEAVFVGMNGNMILICFGVFFLFGGMVFVLTFLHMIGVFNKRKVYDAKEE